MLWLVCRNGCGCSSYTQAQAPPHQALQSCPRPWIGGSPLTLRPHSYRALQSCLSLGSGGLSPIPRPSTWGSVVLSQPWDLGVPLLHLGTPTPGSAVLSQSWDLGVPLLHPGSPRHQALQYCISLGIWGVPLLHPGTPHTRLCSPVSVLGLGGFPPTPRPPCTGLCPSPESQLAWQLL